MAFLEDAKRLAIAIGVVCSAAVAIPSDAQPSAAPDYVTNVDLVGQSGYESSLSAWEHNGAHGTVFVVASVSTGLWKRATGLASTDALMATVESAVNEE